MEEVTEETTIQSEDTPQRKIPLWQNPKFPIVVALVVVVLGILGAGINLYLKTVMPLPPTPSLPFLKEITITPDKTEYEQREIVKITVRNDSGRSIWYIKETCPPSCCNLYRWEEDKWKNLGDPIPCIQLIPPLPGEPYHIEPDELRPTGSISKQWDMMIEGEAAEGGKYRFSFYYGLSKDSYTEKTIYSNEFRIKEKESGEECYQDPREALDNFLSYLHNGHYENAAKLYHRESDFGGYPNQKPFPPGATEEERIKIEARGLADFCYGYAHCLEHEIIDEEVISEDEVAFSVQFYEEGGDVFVLMMPPWVEEEERYATKFSFRIKKIDGCHKSLSVPPMGP